MNIIVDVENILNGGEFLEDSFDTLKQNIEHQIKDDQYQNKIIRMILSSEMK